MNFYGELTAVNILLLSIPTITAILVTAGMKSSFIETVKKATGVNKSKTQQKAMTLDECFDWVNNEFLEDDKREDREIIDDIGNTRSQQLTITSSEDTDFVFRAIKAPYANSEENALFIIVECLTETPIDYDTVEKKSQAKGDMFESSPEVKRLRKMNQHQGLSTDQLRQKTQNMAFSPLYGVQQQPNVQQQQGQNQDNSDDEEGE